MNTVGDTGKICGHGKPEALVVARRILNGCQQTHMAVLNYKLNHFKN